MRLLYSENSLSDLTPDDTYFEIKFPRTTEIIDSKQAVMVLLLEKRSFLTLEVHGSNPFKIIFEHYLSLGWLEKAL